jgi:hypothetical protein
MDRTRTDRNSIVSEGAHAIVDATAEEPADYWLVSEQGEAFPLRQGELDDVATALSRLRGLRSDVGEKPETTELVCPECETAWQYAGSETHAACPNCEAEVPVEGIGP